MLLAAELRAEPSIARGPWLQAILHDSAKVLWRTDEPSEGRVRFRPAGGGPLVTVPSGTTGRRHEARLAELSPSTEYEWEVLDGERVLAAGGDLRFRTAPVPGTGSVRVAAIGDSGDARLEGGAFQHSVTALVRSLEPDVFVHTGDLQYTGTIDEVVFEEYRALLRRVGMTAARGNHSGITPSEWFELFSPPGVDPEIVPCELPPSVCDESPPAGATVPDERPSTFYSFDHGPVHFAVLDSNAEFETCSVQLKWLCSDLRDARERGMPWLVLVVHEPPYTTGLHAVSSRAATGIIPPIADAFGVDLVLSGHDHNYQRSYPVLDGEIVRAWQEPAYDELQGTVYVITGGGGTRLYGRLETAGDAPLFRRFEAVHHAVVIDFSESSLELRARRADGEVIDRITIDRDAPPRRPGFLRGDAMTDGAIDVSDAVGILLHLFRGGDVDCPAALPVTGDANDSGVVDIADAIWLLEFLFLGGPRPPPPFDRCEPVPGFDDRGCLAASCDV